MQGNPIDLPTRWPMVVTQRNRDRTTSKDSKLVNCFVEVDKDVTTDTYIFKRPGTARWIQPAGGAAAGLGCYFFRGYTYSIFGNKFFQDDVEIGTVDGDNGSYTFTSNFNASGAQLFFMNGRSAYSYVIGGSLTEVVAVAPFNFTGTTDGTTNVITAIPSTAAMRVNDVISDNAGGTIIPEGSFIISIDSGTQISISVNTLLAQSAASLTDTPYSAYPQYLVHGCVMLDGTIYVAADSNFLNQGPEIFGSAINDCTVWNPLNAISATIETDTIITIGKQINYILVFKQWSTQVFYDAGNSPGSPLLPQLGNKLPFGCVSHSVLEEIDGMFFLVAASKTYNPQVVVIDNLQYRVISTPEIEKLIDAANFDTAMSWQIKVDGHRFYVLTVPSQNLTLAYDIQQNLWSQWSTSAGNYLPFVESTYVTEGTRVLQHESDGWLYYCDTTYTTDDGALIPVLLRTPSFDFNNRYWKTFQFLEVIGDKTPGSVVRIRWSDNDYQTWSTYREIDMNRIQPRITRLGRFRQRAIELTHACPTPLRLRALDIELAQGTS